MALWMADCEVMQPVDGATGKIVIKIFVSDISSSETNPVAPQDVFLFLKYVF